MAESATDSDRRSRWLLAAGLVMLVTLSYLPTFTAGFIWDDDEYVTQNQNLADVEGLQRIWLDPTSIPQYYPLVHTSYWVEYQLWGLNASGYHITNVVLHAVVSVLLWVTLVRLRIPGAWAIAALFAVHPMNVQTVAWITERKNLLCGLWFFASMLMMVRWLRLDDDTDHTPEDGAPTLSQPGAMWPIYILGLCFFLLAMLSKTVACCLPVVLALVIWWKRGQLDRRAMVALAPFFVVGLLLGLNTVWLERSHVGATGQEWQFEPAQRVLLAGRALWFYTTKLLAPGE